MIPFRCGFGSGNDTQFCFSSIAVCERNNQTNQETCKHCPPGYGPDLSFGHFENCSLPELFFPILLALLSPIYIFEIYYYVMLVRRLRDDLKRACIAVTCLCLSFWIWIICIVVEYGSYEAALTMMMITIVFALILAGLVQYSILKPIYGILHRPIYRVKTIIVGTKVIGSVTVFGLYILTELNVRNPNPGTLNFYTSIILLGVATLAVFEYSVLVIHSRQLQQILKSSENVEKIGGKSLQQIIIRLKHLEVGAGILIFTIAAFDFIVPIVTFFLGSFPYFYIIQSFIFVASILAFPNMYKFLSPMANQKDSSFGNTKQVSANNVEAYNNLNQSD